MTTTEALAPSGLCRTCGVSAKACDGLRDHRARPCCRQCFHVNDTTPELGPVSEAW